MRQSIVTSNTAVERQRRLMRIKVAAGRSFTISLPVARTSVHQAFFEAVLLAVVICWSPSNALAYFVPYVSTAWYILRTRSARSLFNLICCLGLAAGGVVAYGLIATFDYAYQAAFLSLLTYGSFLVLLAFPTAALYSEELRQRILRLLRWVVLIEATLGILQAFYGFSLSGRFTGSNGDYVEGTIHPQLASERSFSNPMFAVNMAVILLALMPDAILNKKGRWILLLGAFSLILASVVHVLYLMVAALLITLVIYRPPLLKRRTGIALITGGIVIGIIMIALIGSNLSLVVNFARLTFDSTTPRAQIVRTALVIMPSKYPLMSYAGLGPGQFSSRAGLIATGYYFGRPWAPATLPFLSPEMSEVFRRYVYQLWMDYSFTSTSRSSSFLPFFSWLSVYVEFGGIVLLAIFAAVAVLLLRVARYARTYPAKIGAIAFGGTLLLILFLGIQENYWEVPQAIWLCILLLKLQYANLVHPNHKFQWKSSNEPARP